MILVQLEKVVFTVTGLMREHFAKRYMNVRMSVSTFKSRLKANLFPNNWHVRTSLGSGSGTNLKVGGHQSRAKVGAPIRRKAPEKNFLVVPIHFWL